MRTIYVTEQGATLHREKRRLVVRKKQEILRRLPAFRLQRILIFGAVQISTQALGFLLDEGIDVSFHTLTGRLRGRLLSSESGDVYLRLAQHDRARDESYRVHFTRAVVRVKNEAQRRILQRHQRDHPSEALEELVHRIALLQRDLELMDTIEGLMGYEGAASRLYFQGFSQMVRGELTFAGRSRRPPRDPVNALLSLGYALLTNEIAALLQAGGFDPFLGIMHGFRYGRRSLSLDLVEEFRQPVVDRFVLSLLNRRQFDASDFRETEDEGVRLRAESLRRFLRLWEERLRGTGLRASPQPRQVFRDQVHELEEAIIHGRLYRPSVWEI